MATSLLLPRLLRVGAGATAELPDLLRSLGLSSPLIVTDPFMLRSGKLDEISARLQSQGITARCFAETVPDPTVQSVEVGVEFLKRGNHDCVVGFGGGSPIDTAKAIAMLSKHGGHIRDYRAPHVEDRPGLPIIAIPTTAGTGSEATRFTIITDGEEKLLCIGAAYMPVAAVVDFEHTLSKPARLTADTGIDALTHAIEANVSRRANHFSDGIARLAMAAIAPNLRRVFQDGTDRDAREQMMIGSLQAGIAFSNSSVALVHAMSRPIGAHFHVAHGLSNAMLLPAVTAFSLPASPERYADCARFMGLTDSSNDALAGETLLQELERLNVDLEVPTPQGFGLDGKKWEASLDMMATQALASGSVSNNPRQATHEEIVGLYRKVWNNN